MGYNPYIHNRQSIRLKKYDYSSKGGYFITICTQNRENLFGQIKNSQIELNNAGEIVKNDWFELINRFGNLKLGEFVIMPNHVHGVLFLKNINNPIEIKKMIGEIIGAFKSLTTNKYIQGVKDGKFKPFDKQIWQRNYYEIIIRNDNDLNKIEQYIINNPQNWLEDNLFSE